MNERWIEIVCSFIGLAIGCIISGLTFTDIRTATVTAIALFVGYGFRTWQTRRWHKLADTESKLNIADVSGSFCLMCKQPKPNDGHSCCEDCGGISF